MNAVLTSWQRHEYHWRAKRPQANACRSCDCEDILCILLQSADSVRDCGRVRNNVRNIKLALREDELVVKDDTVLILKGRWKPTNGSHSLPHI